MNRRKIIMLGGKKSYRQKITALFGSSLIAYWPLDETSGSAAINYGTMGTAGNGAYTGVDLANADGPTGTKTKAPFFDGANDFCNIYSAGLAGAFSGVEGTVLVWRKQFNLTPSNEGLALLQKDASNYIYIKKGSNSDIVFSYVAGGTAKGVEAAGLGAGWIMFALTWSASSDALIAYVSGVQTGATQNGLGIWAGALATKTCILGCAGDIDFPGALYDGWICHAAILNRAATPAELLSVYTLGA